MFFRYFVVLSLIALSAVAIHAKTVKKNNVANVLKVSKLVQPAVKGVADIIGGLFAGSAVNCVVEATEKCSHDVKKPADVMSCGKNFLKENKGRCAAGR